MLFKMRKNYFLIWFVKNYIETLFEFKNSEILQKSLWKNNRERRKIKKKLRLKKTHFGDFCVLAYAQKSHNLKSKSFGVKMTVGQNFNSNELKTYLMCMNKHNQTCRYIWKYQNSKLTNLKSWDCKERMM